MKRQLVMGARALGAGWIMPRLNAGVRALSALTHRLQFEVEWGATPTREWFDHFLDQHYQWGKFGIPLAWERGIFNLLALRQGASVLELCCGDGFNAHHFYAVRAARIVSLDFDAEAIAHARRNFRRANVDYRVGDIRKDLPVGPFSNVIWDAAIEHFTPDEIETVMASIKRRLAADGVLSGYTLVEGEQKAHHEHEYEFKSKEDLLRFLSPHFEHVRVFETVYPTRHNLYFFASDGELPFDETWVAQVISRPDPKVECELAVQWPVTTTTCQAQ